MKPMSKSRSIIGGQAILKSIEESSPFRTRATGHSGVPKTTLACEHCQTSCTEFFRRRSGLCPCSKLLVSPGTAIYFRLLLSHLSLGLRTFMAIQFISPSPHQSGPRRAATLICRTFVRGVSLGTIMPNPGGENKEKAVAFGLMIDDL